MMMKFITISVHWIFINFNGLLVNGEKEEVGKLPFLYGGGCEIIRDQLYWLGGQSNVNQLNHNIYKLSLDRTLNLDQSSIAPWIKLTNLQTTDTIYPNIITTKHKQTILVMGNDTNWQFNPTENPTENRILKLEGESYPHQSSLVRITEEDSEESSLMLMGGMRGESVSDDQYILSDSIEEIHHQLLPIPIYDHTTTLHNNTIYLIGGKNATHHNIDMSIIYLYNLITKSWSNLTTTGTIPTPRSGHHLGTYPSSSTSTNQSLYLTGGMDDQEEFPSDFYKLDLITMVWYKVEIDNYRSPGYRGCLIQPPDTNLLIISFGKHHHYYPITQLLHLSTTTSQPHLLTSYPFTPTTSPTSPSLTLILALTLTILIFTSLLLYLTYRLYRHRHPIRTHQPLIDDLPYSYKLEDCKMNDEMVAYWSDRDQLLLTSTTPQ